MLILTFLVVNIKFHISFKLILSWRPIYSKIQSYSKPVKHIGCLVMDFFACLLVYTLLGIAWTYVIALTSSCGLTIVRIGTVMKCYWGRCFQYQLLSTCIEQGYYALTTNSPEVIVFCKVLCYPGVYISEIYSGYMQY